VTAARFVTRTAGVRRVAAFNWPKLLPGLVVVVVGVGTGHPALAVLPAYFLVVSLAVSWWVYDWSDLHRWEWIAPLLPPTPGRWAIVHAGFDDAGPDLAVALGGSTTLVDVSGALRHTSPSLRRAQHAGAARGARPTGQWLPLGDGSVTGVALVFSAHEVRDAAQRDALFDDLRRVLTPRGRVVLVEHMRDLANVAAFGPAAWHFQPHAEWLRLAARSGFAVTREIRHTPFVRGLALCRP